jgi:hypothetical protein
MQSWHEQTCKLGGSERNDWKQEERRVVSKEKSTENVAAASPLLNAPTWGLDWWSTLSHSTLTTLGIVWRPLLYQFFAGSRAVAFQCPRSQSILQHEALTDGPASSTLSNSTLGIVWSPLLYQFFAGSIAVFFQCLKRVSTSTESIPLGIEKQERQ